MNGYCKENNQDDLGRDFHKQHTHFLGMNYFNFWEAYAVEMGSSWNFPARASPSCEFSGSSEPELGHFDFRAETELKFFKP